MKTLKTRLPGLVFCASIAVLAAILGNHFPLIGGAVFAILIGILLAGPTQPLRATFDAGIKFTSKKILQWAVILLGFGLNLQVIAKTGITVLPIALLTISASLIIAKTLGKALKLQKKTSLLIGVGSAICGGSAIATTAPVIEADDDDVAQAISVIFFFNILACLIFPALGLLLDMSTTSGEIFGTFCGLAVNDTSSVTACAASWDSMHNLQTATLDTAVTVKLTRTLAIIPIVIGLTLLRAREQRQAGQTTTQKLSIIKLFPTFILYFILASLITTLCNTPAIKDTLDTWHLNPSPLFALLKTTAKYFIIWAMAAIGLNTNLKKLLATGWRPLLLGGTCWLAITLITLAMLTLLF